MVPNRTPSGVSGLGDSALRPSCFHRSPKAKGAGIKPGPQHSERKEGEGVNQKMITYSQYLSLLGLASLRDVYVSQLESVGEAVEAIVQEKNDLGHVGDFTWTKDMTVKDLLHKLEIPLPDPPSEAKP